MTAAIPPAIVSEIEARTNCTVRAFSFSGGGCINRGGKITTSNDPYFLKWNDLKKFPGMFAAETSGLAIIRETKTFRVPDVVCTGNAAGFQFLLLEFIEPGQRATDYWEQFGSSLALLHKTTSDKFGLDHDNYIGSLPQRNVQHESWIEFFVEERLVPQLQIARDADKVDQTLLKKFNSLFKQLGSLLPEEPPSLVHGDLWSGNLMVSRGGKPCLIDPAVYYGNREVDLAMTQLFGGFDPSFFDAYNAVYPLHAGYRQRLDLYNLYPLLVHVNLFGGGYASQVTSILDRFG